jgi:hypothetical protein
MPVRARHGAALRGRDARKSGNGAEIEPKAVRTG